MNQIGYLNYSLTFLRRDTIFSLLNLLLESVLFYALAISFLTEKIPLRNESSNIIDLIKLYPDIVFVLVLTIFAFITLYKSVFRASDIGIMMAIGGSKSGVIFLLLLENYLLMIFAFLLSFPAFLFSYQYIITIPIKEELQFFLILGGKSLFFPAALVFIFSLLSSFAASLVDPYKAIRRQR